MLLKRFELSIYRKLPELCTTPAWAVLLVHRSMSNAPSYNVYRDQGKFEHCKLLLELFRLIAMNCGQKLFNPPSCAARLQQMTMTCDRYVMMTSKRRIPILSYIITKLNVSKEKESLFDT